MKIINDHFEVGQKFISMVNGEELTVERIQEAGTYETPYGCKYTLKQALIHFRSEKTWKTYGTDIETAKRLQLRLVEG